MPLRSTDHDVKGDDFVEKQVSHGPGANTTLQAQAAGKSKETLVKDYDQNHAVTRIP